MVNESDAHVETQTNAVHFGLAVRRGAKYGLRMTRETYAQISKRSSTVIPRDRYLRHWERTAHLYEDDDHTIHTDEWCKAHQGRALRNYDLNIALFASLDPMEFHAAVESALGANPRLVEVTDLNKWDGKTGLYVMVLGEYKQVYVGITNGMGGIKARVRQHWSANKQFDRLLFGPENESILSIDSFRALDTTQIFAARVRDPHALEDQVINAFPAKFVINRIRGGSLNVLNVAQAVGVDVFKRRALNG